jgi:hypothetical protein
MPSNEQWAKFGKECAVVLVWIAIMFGPVWLGWTK